MILHISEQNPIFMIAFAFEKLKKKKINAKSHHFRFAYKSPLAYAFILSAYAYFC